MTALPVFGPLRVGWGNTRIAALGRLVGGGTPSKDNLEFWKGSIPWVSPKDMKSSLIQDSEDHISEAALAGSATQMVPKGSLLLVVRSGILQRRIPVAIAARDVSLNQDMKALCPRSVVDARYLLRLVEGFEDRLLQAWRQEGATVESLDSELIRQTRVPLPSLQEQRQIADFLDRKAAAIDALIAKKERLLELLAEKRQAVITEAVTKGLDPSVEMKESGVEWIGRVPRHWRVLPIKRVARVESGHTPSRSVPEYWLDSNSIPWVSLNDTKRIMSADYIDDTEYRINEAGLANSSARLLPSRAVVFTRDATIGKAAITTRPMAVSQHLIAWLCGSQMVPEYLLYWLYALEPHLGLFTFGSTIKTIGMDDVYALITTCPPIDEQRSVVESVRARCRQQDEMISGLLRQIDLLREYRQALITAAVTGELDVTNS